MSANTKPLQKSGDNLPIPQYYNPTSDVFEPTTGSGGSLNMIPQSSGQLVGQLATVATAGVRVQLPNIPCREVTVIALRANNGFIYVGGNNVSSTTYGVELSAKESYTFTVNNANLIYINSSISGEGVSIVVL